MRTLRKILLVLFLSLAILQNQSKAVDFTWTEGDYNLPLPDYMSISTLNISNDVTVTMNGGGVNKFYMYDDSSLTQYGGSINYLYLYGNVSASFFGSSYMNTLYIDPSSTASVKMYAYFDRLDPGGTLHFTWINGGSTSFTLAGQGVFSHIQFIPEPASLLLIGAGLLFARSHRAKKLTTIR